MWDYFVFNICLLNQIVHSSCWRTGALIKGWFPWRTKKVTSQFIEKYSTLSVKTDTYILKKKKKKQLKTLASMSIVYIAYHLQLEGNISGKSCHGNTFLLQMRS